MSPHQRELYKHSGHDTMVVLHYYSTVTLQQYRKQLLSAWSIQGLDFPLSKRMRNFNLVYKKSYLEHGYLINAN